MTAVIDYIVKREELQGTTAREDKIKRVRPLEKAVGQKRLEELLKKSALLDTIRENKGRKAVIIRTTVRKDLVMEGGVLQTTELRGSTVRENAA